MPGRETNPTSQRRRPSQTQHGMKAAPRPQKSKRSQPSPGRHSRFEALLAELTARVIRPGNDQLAGALEPLAEFLNADRIALLEHATEEGSLRPVSSWGTRDMHEPVAALPARQFPWYVGRIARGETFSFADPSELPAEAAAERDFFTEMGTKSCLCFPLLASGKVMGALACVTVGRARVWPPELVERMQYVGAVFANVLLHSRTQRELRRQRDQLTHVGRVAAMGELTAALSHELNQPLTAVLANAQAARRLARDCRANAAEMDQMLADIAASAVRATEIIRRVRGLLRKRAEERRRLAINDVVRETLPIAEAEARELQVNLTFQPADSLPAIIGDRVGLQQVLLNLISNGCHAMAGCPREARKLIVRTSCTRAAGVVVAVCDAGPPMPQDVFGRMFEPFYTTKPSGLGMGLAISRSIVEGHGGQLWATRNESRGATVQFSIPLAARQ